MKWKRNDGIYYSEDGRFDILKATDRIHNGDWRLFDNHIKKEYYGYTLKHAKQIAESLCISLQN